MKKVKIDPGVYGRNYYFSQITKHLTSTSGNLLGLLFSLKGSSHLLDLEYPFQTFVCLNGDMTKYVHYRPSYDDISKDPGYSLSFEHIYDRIDNGNEDLLLLLVSLYGLMDAEALLAALKARPVFPPDPLLDSICKNTNGYLIYREQIEELYMQLTLSDEYEAINFRKYWNKKNTTGRAVTRSIAYSDNMTLEDVIQQRKMANSFDFFAPARYNELENLRHGIKNHPRTN